MSRKTKSVIAAAVAVVAIGLGTGIAVAAGGDDDGSDTPISGAALDRASAAALDAVGEGRVTESEVGDEEGYYEIEVTLDDGSQVDVHLDRDFKVLGQERDGADDRAENESGS